MAKKLKTKETKTKDLIRIFFSYRIPNRKKWLLTDAFLQTFKEELDRIFKTHENEWEPTYWSTYNWFEGTGGFYDALKIASEKHNVKKAIYEYAIRMPWHQADLFDGQLTVLMHQRGIIKEGNIDEIPDGPSEEELLEMEKNGEIEWYEEIKHHKGYSVTKRDWRFVETVLE